MKVSQSKPPDGPVVTKISIFASQVCVPEGWTGQQASDFLYAYEKEQVESFRRLRGDFTEFEPVRATARADVVECELRPGYVHIMLEY